MLLGRKRCQGALPILRVPEDDRCHQQVEAGSPEELVLEGAIAQLAKVVKEDRPRQHLAAGRAIIARLVERFPVSDAWKKDLAWFDGQIATLER
jgi:hypothetical protein